MFAQPSLYPTAMTITKSTLQEGFSYKSVNVGEKSKSGSHAKFSIFSEAENREKREEKNGIE